MTSKNDLRFFDPQIEVKKKAERLQFIPKFFFQSHLKLK